MLRSSKGPFRVFLLPMLLAVLGLAACSGPGAQSDSQPFRNTVVQYAEGFGLDTTGEKLRLAVYRAPDGQPDTTVFVLKDSTWTPQGPNAPWPALPHASGAWALTAVSSLHYLLEADNLASLQALAGADYVFNKPVRQALEAGRIAELGQAGQLNAEAVLQSGAELVVLAGLPSSNVQQLEQLNRLGLPAWVDYSFLEAHPLGRTEWLLMYGALCGNYARTQDTFQAIAARYQHLAALADSLANKQRPRVVRGGPLGGNWFVASGESYAAHLLAAAGGDYAWAELNGRENQQISFEAFYKALQQADSWLDPGGVKSRAELLALDPRLADLPVVQQNQIFTATRQTLPNGPNNLFEQGALRQDQVLGDYMHLLFPQQFGSWRLQYYEQLPTTPQP